MQMQRQMQAFSAQMQIQMERQSNMMRDQMDSNQRMMKAVLKQLKKKKKKKIGVVDPSLPWTVMQHQ
jgi:hypothetical protein